MGRGGERGANSCQVCKFGVCINKVAHAQKKKKAQLLELRLHSYAAQPMRSLAFMLSRLSECDKSVLKPPLRDRLSSSSFYVMQKNKKGSFAHLVAEQHDDHVLLGILVYFS